MICKIKLFVFLVVLNNFLFSQVSIYKPFPKNYAVWKISGWHNINTTSPSYFTYRKFMVLGDTVVNSVSYKNVKYYNYPGGNPGQPPGPLLLSFGYRNDSINKKVYYLSLTTTNAVEQLWYDFNLNVGDTLKDTFAFTNPPWAGNSNTRRIVSSIDSVVFCGLYYKRFNFNNCAWGSGLSLIEGVGFEDNFIQTGFRDCPFEPLTIYTSTFSTCDFSGIQRNKEDKPVLILYPNPVNTELKISSPLQITNYEIFDNTGSVVIKHSIFSGTINVSLLPNALYILKVIDEKGNLHYSKFIKQ